MLPLVLPAAAELPPLPKRPCIVAPASYRGGTRPAAIDSLVSSTHPIRVHYNRVEDAARAALVLEYAELSWVKQVDELGFRAPVLPDGPNGGVDGPEFDIYLTPVGNLEAWTWAPQQADDTVGDDQMGAYSYIAIDHNMPEIWIPSYTAHEFQHATQWATDFTEPTLPIWEGTANAAQKWTLGEDSDWDYDIYAFQEVPWAPTLVGDGATAWENYEAGWTFEYGSALWVMVLDEKLGDADGRGAVRLWQEAANEGWSLEPDVVDAVEAVAGRSMGAFLNDVAIARWLTGTRWDGRGLADAEHWGTDEQLLPEAQVSTTSLPAQLAFPNGPMITGQGFVEVSHDGSPAFVEVDVLSLTGLHSGVMAISHGASTAFEVGSYGADPRVVLDLEGVTSFAVAVTNLGPVGWDGEDDPWVAGDQILTIAITDDPNATPLPEEEARACGCASQSPAAWLWPPALVGLRRRRR